MKLSYTQAIDYIRDLIQNEDVAEATLQRYFNLGATRFYGAIKRHVNVTSRNKTLASGTRFFYMPPQMTRLVAMYVDIDDQQYPLIPEESEYRWSLLRADTEQESDQPTLYHVRNNYIELYPKLSTERAFTIVGEQVIPELSNADYTEGNIIEIDGATVTGSGTTFTDDMVGRFFKIDDDTFWYEIASVTDATNLELVQPYEGISVASAEGYTIGEVLDLPDDLQEGPIHYACMRYFQGNRRHQSKYVEHKAEYRELLGIAEEKYSHQSRSKVHNTKLRKYGRVWNSVTHPQNLTS